MSTSRDKTTRALFPPPPPLENYAFKAGMLNACPGTHQRPLRLFHLSPPTSIGIVGIVILEFLFRADVLSTSLHLSFSLDFS